MKRIGTILITILMAVFPGYSEFFQYAGTGTETINLVNTNFTGDPMQLGILGAGVFVQSVSSLNVRSSQIYGAPSIPSPNTAFGGVGLVAVAIDETHIFNDTMIYGGSGTNVASPPRFAADVKAFGGLGAALVGASLADTMIISNATVYGGSAGTITNTLDANHGDFLAYGGNGVRVFQNGTLDVRDDTRIYGGNGGVVINSEELTYVISTNNSVVTTNLVPTTANHSDLRGGLGILLEAGTLLASDGALVYGGHGGSFTADPTITSNITANASGGSGLAIQSIGNSITNSGGTYFGGNGGFVVGAKTGSAFGGSGVLITNSADVYLTGGTYSKGVGGTVNGIQQAGGGAAEIQDSTVTIADGTYLGDILVSGEGASTLTISGGDIREALNFSGTGSSTVFLQNSLTGFSGMIMQTAGMATFEAWEDSHFLDTRIYGGTMNFNSQFDLVDGNAFALLGAGNGMVNFNGNLIAHPGSQIVTTSDTNGISSFIGGEDLEFREGVKWIIDGGDIRVTNGMDFTMAQAQGLISNFLDKSDVEYAGTYDSWLGTIDSMVTSNSVLTGTYRFQLFEVALGVDSNTKFGSAMSTLSDFTGIDTSGEDEYVGIKDPTLTKEKADLLFRSAYYSSEMASTLIRLQGLFADHISERTRSYLRNKNWASPSSSPQGAKGSKYAVDIPPGYEAWGRGYGSYFNQGETAGFGGYDATVGGAVLGADKKFSNLLLGLGGGYAHTTLQENWGRVSESDTLYGTAYAALNSEHTFLEVSGNYAFTDVTTGADPRVGDYEGDFNAYTASLYLGGGIGFSTFKDSVLITPEASLLTTFYDRDGYTENALSTDGSWPDKIYDAYDQTSYLSSLGLTLSMIEKIESFDLEMEFQPELRAHWLHEFNAEMDNETYIMAGSPQEAVLQAREENLAKLGGGVRFSSWESDSLEIGLDIDVVLGEDYEAYIGSAKLLHRF